MEAYTPIKAAPSVGTCALYAAIIVLAVFMVMYYLRMSQPKHSKKAAKATTASADTADAAASAGESFANPLHEMDSRGITSSLLGNTAGYAHL